jgi:hypothetical protein
MKRGFIALSLITLLLILPFASAGLWEFLNRKIQLGPTQEVSLTVAGANPEVTIQSATTPSISDGGSADTTIVFDVIDINGADDVDMSGGFEAIDITLTDPSAAYTRSGTDTNCGVGTPITNGFTYTCTITMQFYDEIGDWDVEVTVTDKDNNPGTDMNLDYFTINELKAISLNVGTISFGSVTPGVSDFILSGDTIVTNNGNFIINHPTTSMTITAVGLTNIVDTITVDLFKSADQSVITFDQGTCTGGIVHTGLAIELSDFDLYIANQGDETPPTRDVQHCLTDVPAGLSSGVYETISNAGWDFII